MAVSLAVHDFLQPLLPDGLCIKWPNDIYWQDFKMGGILIENAIQGENLTHAIVGIGLNINQLDFAGNPRATSLRRINRASTDGDEWSLEILLNALLESLEKRYLQLRSNNLLAGQGFADLERYYLQNLYGFGQTRRFRSDGHDFEGVITGIDPVGRLSVREGNETRHFSFKEIEFVFQNAI
jgi:BirA family transcriptional regulator, biotin operon repressor / biotin---[acetyl-CoA-carboxylase] ligase